MYIFRNPSSFRIQWLPLPEGIDPELRFTVDYPEDLKTCEWALAAGAADSATALMQFVCCTPSFEAAVRKIAKAYPKIYPKAVLMRIHLLCDQKWRDLPNLAAVKIALERCGHRVLLSTTKDAAAMIRVFRPHCVVLNHLFATRNQRLAVALKQSGVGVVILPTEGAARPELRPLIAGEFADFSGMDLHLAWSEASAEDSAPPLESRCAGGSGHRLHAFRFLHARFRSAITPRDEFCRQQDLDPDRPIITWATAYNHAEMGNTPEVLARYMAEIEDNGFAACYRRIGLVPQRIPSMQAVERREATAAFMQLAAAMPQVQFVIRAASGRAARILSRIFLRA